MKAGYIIEGKKTIYFAGSFMVINAFLAIVSGESYWYFGLDSMEV